MLPKNLHFQNKVESSPAKSYKTNVPPQNGTTYSELGVGTSNVLYFNIPTRNNLTLDTLNSYLRFDFRYNNKSGTNTPVVAWDKCGAHGIIQRVRVYHGSNLLEDIDNYGNMVKMLYDLQLEYGSMFGKYNITTGTRAEMSVSTTTSDILVNAGEVLNSGIAIPINSSMAYRTYCLNLVSIIGSLNDKYFPLFECTSAPIRLEIWLVDNVTKALASSSATAGADTYSLQNVEFVCSLVEISDQAIGVIRGSQGGKPLQYVINGWRNYGWTTPQFVAGTAQTVNMPIPAKFSSLKGLFVTLRDQGTGAAQYFPFASGTLGTFNQYYFRIGSLVNPMKPPFSLPEAFCELMKGISPLGDVGTSPTITYSTYSATAQTALTSQAAICAGVSNSFYIGLDLENYPSAEKGSVFAGWNSNTDDIFFVYDVTPSINTTARLDSYAHYDSILIFENGTCYVRY